MQDSSQRKWANKKFHVHSYSSLSPHFVHSYHLFSAGDDVLWRQNSQGWWLHDMGAGRILYSWFISPVTFWCSLTIIAGLCISTLCVVCVYFKTLKFFYCSNSKRITVNVLCLLFYIHCLKITRLQRIRKILFIIFLSYFNISNIISIWTLIRGRNLSWKVKTILLHFQKYQSDLLILIWWTRKAQTRISAGGHVIHRTTHQHNHHHTRRWCSQKRVLTEW